MISWGNERDCMTTKKTPTLKYLKTILESMDDKDLEEPIEVWVLSPDGIDAENGPSGILWTMIHPHSRAVRGITYLKGSMMGKVFFHFQCSALSTLVGHLVGE